MLTEMEQRTHIDIISHAEPKPALEQFETAQVREARAIMIEGRRKTWAPPLLVGAFAGAVAISAAVNACAEQGDSGADARRALLLNPDAAEWRVRAPELFRVRMETSKGAIVIEVHRNWAPYGADRFFNLVRNGYYDDTRFFRVIENRWAQFGINGDPAISAAWRKRTIPDDARAVSNTLGTIAYAFAVADGRATQVFINLRDNSATHDAEGFVPFGRVVEGMEHALALNAEYGEKAGSGIRAGHQDRLFAEGNAYLDKEFPQLDRIVRATIVKGAE
jgi:peptidyl-prolyl cis-trans isomerase A (cyclophilin A)